MTNPDNEIFISYAWGEGREDIVDKLYNTFSKKGYNIIRDKVNLGYKGSITQFMNRIGKGKAIVVVISDKYLRSENCMYEIVQIQRQGKFHDRIFPIVLGDANFYQPVKRLEYVKYWENKKKELIESMRGIDDMSAIGDVHKELSNYDEIFKSISNIMFVLKDMNTLTPDMHTDSNFDIITEKINTLFSADNQPDTKPHNHNETELLRQKLAEAEQQRQELQNRLANIETASKINVIEAATPTAKSQQPTPPTNTFTDPRDGKVYKTVQIGNQIWMAENLAYKPIGGSIWRYNNDPSKVHTYGYLYDWKAACNASPDGWHLPTDEEWNLLEMALGLSKEEATKIGIRGNHAKLLADEKKLNVLWAGCYNNRGTWQGIGTSAYFWTSSVMYQNEVWVRAFENSNEKVIREAKQNYLGLSVRCVRD